MPTPIAAYVLTLNSERRLAQALASLQPIADEIIVVDSGSSDRSLDIARSYGVRILHRPFDNFRDQRLFAEANCSHQWILQLDSDEVLSEPLIAKIRELKARGLRSDDGSVPDGFSFPREWYVLGKAVHVFYPITCPDSVIRLFQKERLSHKGSRGIHESIRGPNRCIARVHLPVMHYTCDSISDLYSKINLYSRLAAEDMQSRGERSSWLKIHLYPWLLWFRWYVMRGGWRDGEIGRIHGRYIRDTIWLKYVMLKHDFEGISRDVR